MGMTIDLAIEELESTKDYPANDPASDEALDFAISIMRKYQKIEHIVKAEIPYKLVEIEKVVEDGRN